MAWAEGLTWEMEQGLPAQLELHLFSDANGTTVWPFEGWQVKATVSNANGSVVHAVTTEVEPLNGVVRLKLPEQTVNSLVDEKVSRFDCLLIAPLDEYDNHFLATGSVMVSFRTSRRAQQ